VHNHLDRLQSTGFHFATLFHKAARPLCFSSIFVHNHLDRLQSTGFHFVTLFRSVVKFLCLASICCTTSLLGMLVAIQSRFYFIWVLHDIKDYVKQLSLQNRHWGASRWHASAGRFLRFGGSSARIPIGPSPWRVDGSSLEPSTLHPQNTTMIDLIY
jgi:hypothetical protein